MANESFHHANVIVMGTMKQEVFELLISQRGVTFNDLPNEQRGVMVADKPSDVAP
jgi:tRNA(His) 5'-end guanylyltransferase